MFRPAIASKRGQTLLVIESMKIETSIKAWRDGVWRPLHVARRDIRTHAPLVTLAPAEAEER